VKATQVQPDNPEAWFKLGLYAFEPPARIKRCVRTAYDAFNRLNVLDPQGGDNVYYAQALKIVNAGKATACNT
jgi:hypothetical protein